MNTNIGIRTTPGQRQLWEIAAIAQDYASFSEFIRAAITEKADKTGEILKARKAVLEAMVSNEP